MKTLEQDPIDTDVRRRHSIRDNIRSQNVVSLSEKIGRNNARGLYREMEDWYREENRSMAGAV